MICPDAFENRLTLFPMWFVWLQSIWYHSIFCQVGTQRTIGESGRKWKRPPLTGKWTSTCTKGAGKKNVGPFSPVCPISMASVRLCQAPFASVFSFSFSFRACSLLCIWPVSRKINVNELVLKLFVRTMCLGNLIYVFGMLVKIEEARRSGQGNDHASSQRSSFSTQM